MQSSLVQMSDDLSCSVFGLVVFVTASYYYLLVTGEIKDDKKVGELHSVFCWYANLSTN